MTVADAQSLARSLVALLVNSGVVLKGCFKLKSGQTSDYFIDFGSLERASSLHELGRCYAEKIVNDIGIDKFDVIFGPSYKGVAIAIATAMELNHRYGADKTYSFNRKVEKEHGEGGMFIGRKPIKGDRILIVDDVITDGGTKYEMIDLLREHTEAEIVGVLVGVDRSEPGVVDAFIKTTDVAMWSIADSESLSTAPLAAG